MLLCNFFSFFFFFLFFKVYSKQVFRFRIPSLLLVSTKTTISPLLSSFSAFVCWISVRGLKGLLYQPLQIEFQELLVVFHNSHKARVLDNLDQDSSVWILQVNLVWRLKPLRIRSEEVKQSGSESVSRSTKKKEKKKKLHLSY